MLESPQMCCGALNRHFCQLKISEAKPMLANASFIHPAIHDPLFDVWIGIK
jgi:hypothetical protein